ncbi:MAG: hypothetical protein JNK65_06220 [Deltaproteobacteria bacterium]|nr:hypothetical protein [Deltaproteobacteria bacterium]
MKNFFYLCLLLLFSACANNPGGSKGNEGSVGISFNSEAHETFSTLDAYSVKISHFILPISKIEMGNFSYPIDKTFDLHHESLVDAITLNAVPGVQYNDLQMTLNQITEIENHASHLIHKNESNEHDHAEEEIPEEAHGHSLYIEALATRDTNTCTLKILLEDPDFKISIPFENPIKITANRENDLVLELHPEKIFESLSLEESCHHDSEVIISHENPSMLNSILLALSESFKIISKTEENSNDEEGHSHAH